MQKHQEKEDGPGLLLLHSDWRSLTIRLNILMNNETGVVREMVEKMDVWRL